MSVGIAFTLTYRCPLKCKICLIEAGPDKRVDMPVSDAITYLNALQRFEIANVALTGGEPFLTYDLLLKSLQHATRLGLTTTTGTSAYWAKTKERALALLKPLSEEGLKAISFSADEWHQEFVPLECIKNGIEAAREIGFERIGMQTTITSQGKRMKDTIDQLKSMGCDLSGLFFVETPATISGRAATDVDASQFLYFFRAREIKVPCTFIGTIFAIMPDGWVTPCCNAYPVGLRIGNAHFRPLGEIIETIGENPLYQVLSSRGMHELVKTIEDNNLNYTFRETYAGLCHLCYDILKDQKLAEDIYHALGADPPWGG